MKNIRKVISIIAALTLVGVSFGSSNPSNSVPSRSGPPEIPAQITESSTAMLFFFWGYLDAEDAINNLGDLPRHSFRDMAAVARVYAVHFAGNLPAVAYSLGRAYAFDREADRQGES